MGALIQEYVKRKEQNWVRIDERKKQDVRTYIDETKKKKKKRPMNEEEKNIVEDNKKLAYWFATRWHYKMPYEEFEDVAQLCFVGLIKAAKTFDDSKSKFATYASTCMRNELLMHMKKHAKFNINSIPASSYNFSNIQNNDNDAGSNEYDYLFPFYENFMKNINKEYLMSIVEKLPKKQRFVIHVYYIDDIRDQVFIGRMLGVSQSYVCRLMKKAIKNLREEYFRLLEIE